MFPNWSCRGGTWWNHTGSSPRNSSQASARDKQSVACRFGLSVLSWTAFPNKGWFLLEMKAGQFFGGSSWHFLRRRGRGRSGAGLVSPNWRQPVHGVPRPAGPIWTPSLRNRSGGRS